MMMIKSTTMTTKVIALYLSLIIVTLTTLLLFQLPSPGRAQNDCKSTKCIKT